LIINYLKAISNTEFELLHLYISFECVHDKYIEENVNYEKPISDDVRRIVPAKNIRVRLDKE